MLILSVCISIGVGIGVCVRGQSVTIKSMLFPTAICRLRVKSTLHLSRPSNSLWRHSAFSKTFSVSHTRRNSNSQHSFDNSQNTLIYDAPLASTFRKLKIFSLSSLTLSCSMAPLIFIIESQIPVFARTCLAFLAVSTSGVSTGLIGACKWCVYLQLGLSCLKQHGQAIHTSLHYVE